MKLQRSLVLVWSLLAFLPARGEDPDRLQALLAAAEGPVSEKVLALLQAPEGTGPPADAEEEEEKPARHRSRIERLAQRLSVGTTFTLREGTLASWLRIRYSRAVRYEFDEEAYSLTESYEIVPGIALSGSTDVPAHELVGQAVLEKPFRFTVRRIRYPTWGTALFAPPYPIGRLPLDREKALELQPGDSVTISSGTALFVGALLFSNNRDWRGDARAGLLMPSDYDATVERLTVPDDEGREWILSVGGTIRRQWTLRYLLRSPRVFGIRSLRLFNVSWTPSDHGLRFFYASDPMDLRRSEFGPLYRGIMTGAARLPDVALFGKTFRVFLRRDIDERTMESIQDLAEFRRVARLSAEEEEVPWTRALTGLHGKDFELRLWILVYRLNWSIERSDDETLVDPRDARGGRFFSVSARNERSRGWLFFPRESHRLEMTTLQDAATGEMVTEARVEINNHRRGAREAARDARLIRAFLGPPVLETFPVQPAAVFDPTRPAFLVPGLPDLDQLPAHPESASVNLRCILGTRFHHPDGPPADWLPVRIRDARALQNAFRNAYQDEIPEPAMLLSRLGMQDAFASFRIEIAPHDKKRRASEPPRIYVGSTGRPERDVRGYARLRRLFDSAAAVY